MGKLLTVEGDVTILQFCAVARATLALTAFALASFGAARPAHACFGDGFFTWQQAFDASSLVVKGKLVNSRLVLENVPKPRPRMVGGARFVPAPWAPKTTSGENSDGLWFLYADIEVAEILSGTAGDLVTIVFGPARESADLALIGLPKGRSETIFMLENPQKMVNLASSHPLQNGALTLSADLFRLMKYGRKPCGGSPESSATFPTQDMVEAITTYAKDR